MQCEIRKESFDVLTRIILHLWRHGVWPSLLANEDDVKKEDEKPTLTRTKNQFNGNFHTIQFNKIFFLFSCTKPPCDQVEQNILAKQFPKTEIPNNQTK